MLTVLVARYKFFVDLYSDPKRPVTYTTTMQNLHEKAASDIMGMIGAVITYMYLRYTENEHSKRMPYTVPEKIANDIMGTLSPRSRR